MVLRGGTSPGHGAPTDSVRRQPAKTSLATVIADIALGQPAQKARWMIASLSSVSVRPFCFAMPRWARSCSVLPPVIKRGGGDEAAMPRRKFLALPDVAEQHVISQGHELRCEVADDLLSVSLGFLFRHSQS